MDRDDRPSIRANPCAPNDCHSPATEIRGRGRLVAPTVPTSQSKKTPAKSPAPSGSSVWTAKTDESSSITRAAPTAVSPGRPTARPSSTAGFRRKPHANSSPSRVPAVIRKSSPTTSAANLLHLLGPRQTDAGSLAPEYRRSRRSSGGKSLFQARTKKLISTSPLRSERCQFTADRPMNLIDYNGEGRWSREAILDRYARYAAELGIAHRDLSPLEHNERGRHWVYPG